MKNLIQLPHLAYMTFNAVVLNQGARAHNETVTNFKGEPSPRMI